MQKHSKVNYLLADASKINGKSFFQICHLEECTEIFCENTCPLEWQTYEEKWTVCNGGKS